MSIPGSGIKWLRLCLSSEEFWPQRWHRYQYGLLQSIQNVMMQSVLIFGSIKLKKYFTSLELRHLGGDNKLRIKYPTDFVFIVYIKVLARIDLQLVIERGWLQLNAYTLKCVIFYQISPRYVNLLSGPTSVRMVLEPCEGQALR